MADLDLNDPGHLAELLRASLPGFDDESPEQVAPHVEALGRSSNDIFSEVGTGHRIVEDDDAPVEQQGPDPDEHHDEIQQQIQQAPQELDAPAPEQSPIQQLPLDLGGEGELLLDPGQGREIAGIAGIPVRARRGWTEIDRTRSKGAHPIYDLAASHVRTKPIRAAFTGHCQAVRVVLPVQKPSADAFIGTWIGTVEAKDHLAFSVEEVIARYEAATGRRPVVGRVELITGARFRGRRFSPVSIYLAYRDTGPNAAPIFYMLEGGSAAGKPEALYVAKAMGREIHTKSGFAFTPFACANNWYEGGLATSEDLREPACVYLTAAQTKDGRHEYIKLSIVYDRDRELRRVVHPFELQVEAALRVMAIADEARCQLRTGGGGELQHSLGPLMRALLRWDQKPEGTTTPQERRQFCGCPKP